MATKLSTQKEKTPKLPFSEPDITSDIVFIVEGQPIHFTKAFLIASSPVFERMFHSDFAEKNAKEITLPIKKYGDILELFGQIHPAFAPMAAVTDANLLALLDLSREYGMTAVYGKCQAYICREAYIRPAGGFGSAPARGAGGLSPGGHFGSGGGGLSPRVGAGGFGSGGGGGFGSGGGGGFGSGGGGGFGRTVGVSKPAPKLIGYDDLDPSRLMLFLYACEQYDFQEYLGVLKDIASVKNTDDIERSQFYAFLQEKTLLDIYRARCKNLKG